MKLEAKPEFICVGIGKTFNTDQYIDATKSAISDYLENQGIDIASTIIVIIKTHGALKKLTNVNEIAELVQENFQCDICLSYKQIEDSEIKNQLEIILVGM